MKTKLRLLGSMMLLFMVTYGAQAVVIFQDNFSEYANGPLGTNTPTWFSPPGDPTYATNLQISVSSGSVVINYAGSASVQSWALFTNGVPGYSITLPSSGPGAAITNTSGTCYYFPSNGPVAALYASFTMNVSSAFSGSASGDYFAMFLNTNFNLHPRVYICTNSATPGTYRLLLNNNSSPSTGTNGVEIVSQDLSYGTSYDVVFKQVLSTGLSTLWVGTSFPSSEVADAGLTNLTVSPTAAQSSVLLGGGITLADTTGTNVPSFTALCGFGFHTGSAYGTGAITINNLVCGTTFADVVPASDGFNPPFISIAPASGTYITGSPVTLSVVAGGDQDTMTYQWYGPSGQIIGATSSNYTIVSVISGASGYSVAITNAAGNVTSGTATITGLNSGATPTISSGPNSTSTTFGSSATFSVTASDGGAPLTYQWYGPAGIITGQTNASLALSSIIYAQAGSYSVVVGNYNGTTGSSNATLTVNAPAISTIAYVRSLLDNTNFNTNGSTALFTINGTNNTWENQTTAGNSEFNIQDGTGGMNIFWSGADGFTNQPPAGAVLTITAPLAEFDGILELEPIYGNPFHSVVTNSTNGILPVPMPLPFDPNMVGNPTNMQKHLMSSYFVASNVFLDLSSGATFADDGADPLTNGQAYTYNLTFSSPSNSSTTVVTNFTVAVTNQIGQTNVIFYNDHVINFIGATKPIGPCTIYGILSIHVTSMPYTSGYEFVATRLADIIPALQFTNVISNIIRYGDLPTNSYVQNVLQPGETLTMTVVASDPGGGTVSVGTLGGNGTWSAVSGNHTTTASATYTYTGTVGEENTTDTPTMPVTFSSSGFSSTYTWSIYVPTVPEQSMRITEVLPYAASNTNSPAYNPLGRALPEVNSVSYDQYVEIVNFGSSSVGMTFWNVGNGSTSLHEFTSGESLEPGNSAVVYGGLLNDDPDPPTISTPAYLEPASTGNGLTLTASAGVITLLDNHGNLVDRVAYPAAGSQVLDTNFNYTGQTQANFPVCSYSRFPGMNSPLVPQPFISTNYVTPGTQYDGSFWSSATQVPAGVGPITTTAAGGTVNLSFTAGTVNTTTLWLGNSLLQPFTVLTGGVFSNTSGSFTISNVPPNYQYYYITTETAGGHIISD